MLKYIITDLEMSYPSNVELCVETEGSIILPLNSYQGMKLYYSSGVKKSQKTGQTVLSKT